MKKEDFISRYRAEMADVHVSPQLKRRTLDVIEGKENVVMKKKLSAAVVFVMAIFLIGAVALAAANRAGILDFVGRYADAYVPEDAQAYVQTDVLTMENELVTVNVRELYYDGYVSRMTVDITPKDPATMLLGMDMAPEDKWQNMTRMNGEWDDSDERTAIDVFREGGYQRAYSVDSWLWPEAGATIGGSGDYNLGEDGVLTLYTQVEYADVQSERDTTFRLYLTPFSQPFAENSTHLSEEKLVMQMPLALKQADYQNETYVSTEAVDYPSVGVRVDEIRLEVRAQEIHATIDYTVTDRAVYNALDDGLWFEFIDPESTADQPYDQRLQSGLTGIGSNGPSDGKELETAVHFRQTETLGRNELHESYTLRAFDSWEKDRYETHTFTMKKVDGEE